MLTLIAAVALMPNEGWHALYSDVFCVDPAVAQNYRAVVSWHGSMDPRRYISDTSPDATMIDLYELHDDGTKKLVTSTEVWDGLVVSSLSTHNFRQGGDGSATFLATSQSGGQHARASVWWFDPHSKRPVEKLNVLYGETGRLGMGLLVENSPANYVDPGEWPKGVASRSEYVEREWSFDVRAFEFKPGPWRLQK